jgi:threonyl-tRNA synthetase
LLVVGAKEQQAETVSVRTQQGVDLGTFRLRELAELFSAELTKRSSID